MYILISINKIVAFIISQSFSSLYAITSFISANTQRKGNPKMSKRYYVSSVHIKNYSANPLDTFHIKK